jgi:hypothetical protein
MLLRSLRKRSFSFTERDFRPGHLGQTMEFCENPAFGHRLPSLLSPVFLPELSSLKDLSAGDSVVVLRGCLSDIKRFGSFPRHGVVVTVYGIGRIGNRTRKRRYMCRLRHRRLFRLLCFLSSVHDFSFSLCYHIHLINDHYSHIL